MYMVHVVSKHGFVCLLELVKVHLLDDSLGGSSVYSCHHTEQVVDYYTETQHLLANFYSALICPEEVGAA
jgi:hypothetical protein